MALAPTSSRSSGVTVPFDAISSPAGTEFQVDEFGDLFIKGTGGNTGYLEVRGTAPSGAATLSSGDGVALSSTGGSLTARITIAGVISTKAHSAPADGDLETGECALWFDQTNGAAKLMVKAKSADGTVVAASVALA